MIDVYYWPTPNGKKVTILLEETGLAYNLIPLDIGRGDQFSPAYLQLNPNHRLPAIVDHEPIGGGDGPINVFESGAILFYLAEKAGQFWPQEPHQKYEVVQWVVWQVANQGPKLGEAGHFLRLGDKQGDQSYAVRRFTDEANRLYGVLNNRLYDRPYLAGEDYTIADIANYPWATAWQGQGQDIEEFKYVKRWLAAVGERPAVQRGLAAGRELTVDQAKLPPEEIERRAKILYNQRARPTPS
jgi:GST-like protein